MTELDRAVVSILVNLLSSDVGAYGKSISFKIRRFRWKKSLEKWLMKYEMEHDGTILTEGRFLQTLKFQKPVEEIYAFVCGTSSNASDAAFVTDLVQKTKRSIDGGVDASSESEIHHFYEELLKKTTEMRQALLPEAEKTLLREIKQTQYNLGDLIVEQNRDIKMFLENLQMKQLSETEKESLFNYFNDLFWKGEFEKLCNLCSAVEGKCDDLAIWIKLSLSVFVYNPPYGIRFSEYKNICNPEIRDDIIRKEYLVKLFENDNESFDAIPYAPELQKIINNVNNNDYSAIYAENREKKGNTMIVGIKLNNGGSEEWFVRRIMLVHMRKLPYSSLYESMREIIGKDTDFFVDLLCFMQMVSEAYKDKDELLDSTYQKIISKKELYCGLIPSICASFYGACILYNIHNDNKETLCKILNEIPSAIRSHEYVIDYVFLAQITLGASNYDELLTRCKKTGEYWLLHNYYMSVESPMKIAQMIESQKDFLLNNPLIYLDYVRAIHFIGEVEKRDKLLNEYRESYGDLFDYWMTRVELLEKEEDVDFLTKMWKEGNLKFCTPMADAIIAEIFYKWKRFQMCIEAVKNCEDKGIADENVKQYKVASLLSIGKKVEAFSELCSLFEQGIYQDFVIVNILSLSLQLNRSTPKKLIEYVRSNKEPVSILLSAQISERDGLKDEAREWYRKALILSDGRDVRICGYYWAFSVRDESHSIREVKGVDIDTTISMKNTETGAVKYVCICDKTYIPKDYYIWNGIIHLSIDMAVQYRLLRMRSGEEIDFDGSRYLIEEIIPIECFYDRYCLSKMIEANVVKAFTGPLGDDPETNINKLTDWLRENVGENDMAINLLREYEDFSKRPLPLYVLSKNTSVPYAHYVKSIIESKDIIVREAYDFNKDTESSSETGYVLCFSTIVCLFLIGVSSEVLAKHDVYIPESAYIEIMKENEQSQNDNNRDMVATMGLYKGELSVTQVEEAEKISRMKFAVDMLNYCQGIPQIENSESIANEVITEDKIMTLYGVADFDAISICKTKGYALVSIEQFISELANMPGVEVKNINMMDFLQELGFGLEERLSMMKTMVGFRMINVLSCSVLQDVSTIQMDLDGSAEKKWMEYLDEIDKTRGKYRELLQAEFTTIARNGLGRIGKDLSPGIRAFMGLTMKLNSLKFAHGFNEKGEIVVGIVREAYDDKDDVD